MDYRTLSKKKASKIKTFSDDLSKLIEEIQKEVKDTAEESLSLFEEDSDVVKLTVRNAQKLSKTKDRLNTLVLASFVALFALIAKKEWDTWQLNKAYIKSMVSLDKSVEQKARDRVLLSLGIRDNKLISGGWLSGIGSPDAVVGLVMREIAQVMAANTSLSTFRKRFKSVFVGVGLIERYFNGFTFDLFNKIDRAHGVELAEQVGLKHAIYSGTIKNNTRDFCRERVSEVFTKDQIKNWENLNWKGKNKNYNPYIDLGGYNCRHSLDWITEELANTLKSN